MGLGKIDSPHPFSFPSNRFDFEAVGLFSWDLLEKVPKQEDQQEFDLVGLPQIFQERAHLMKYLEMSSPEAIQVVETIHKGDVEGLKRLLLNQPDFATIRLISPEKSNQPKTARTLLHIVTDWPGHFPNGPEMVKALVAAGADVNAPFEGPHPETPLHWAASSDDHAVLETLLELGANLEAPGAVIGGGTPLADAAAFGNWKSARALLNWGAKTTLWQAAALGLLEQVKGHFTGKPLSPFSPRGPRPNEAAPDEITHAFWAACHGSQLTTAEYLLDRGANINWIGHDRLTPLGIAKRGGDMNLINWLIQHGSKMTEELN